MKTFNQWLFENTNSIGPVYHGGDWNGITPVKVTSRGALGSGAYFTPDISRAKEYQKESGGKYVVEAFLRINKPLVLNMNKEHACVQALVQLGMNEEAARDFVEKIEEEKGYLGKQISSRAVAQGYDGILQYKDGHLMEAVIWNSFQVQDAKLKI